MSYDDLIELNRQLTREKDGVQYYGIFPWLNLYLWQASQPRIDMDNQRALVVTKAMREAVNIQEQIFSVPGYRDVATSFWNHNDFLKDQIAGMRIFFLNGIAPMLQNAYLEYGDSFRWDMVTMPFQEGKPGIVNPVDVHALMLSTTSKQKDEAFQVMAFLGSDEVQKLVNQTGRLTASSNPALRSNYAENLSGWQGKNIEGALNVENAPLHQPITRYDGIAHNFWGQIENRLLIGEDDINTIIREAQEAADVELLEAIQQEK